jgi:hypothetical protein
MVNKEDTVTKFENRLRQMHKQIKNKVPAVRCLTFSLSEYDHAPSVIKFSGFIHVGPDCDMFDSMTELKDIVAKKQRKDILSWKFDHVLK